MNTWEVVECGHGEDSDDDRKVGEKIAHPRREVAREPWHFEYIMPRWLCHA